MPVPRGVGVRAAAVASGQAARAEPRDAATVVLIREGDAGVEVLLLRRTKALDFAPGACVFPGGSVDAADRSGDGPAPEGLGVPAERARALVRAGVRETLEESGVRLDPAQLVPWARWITPEAADRRFDTWFFAAGLPAGEQVEAHDGESDSATWWRPEDALDAARAGQITLLPPTAVTLAELAAIPGGVAAVLAEPRVVTPLMPSVTVEDGQAWLIMPSGTEYPL